MAESAHAKVEETARLEAALDRIARGRARLGPGAPQESDQKADLVRRLDDLIAELRAVLGRDLAD